MKDKSHASKDSSTSNKWLVRILLIVGIGIPVLIELFTFSGLVSTHLFTEDTSPDNEQVNNREESVRDQQAARGDSLFVDAGFPTVIQFLQLEIYPDRWVFVMRLQALDRGGEKYQRTEIKIGELVTGQKTWNQSRSFQWAEDSSLTDSVRWTLAGGERPKRAEVILIRYPFPSATEDTMRVRRVIEFGHIPAQYHR